MELHKDGEILEYDLNQVKLLLKKRKDIVRAEDKLNNW